MSQYNNSLRYFKTYYEQINWAANSDDSSNATIFQAQNELLLRAKLDPADHPLAYPQGLEGFELETTYPGLLVGSGINHGSGLLGEMKLGFFFDYTTGLPLLAGSSVKGVLRSAFPQGYRVAATKGQKNAQHSDLLRQKEDQVRAYLQMQLEKVNPGVEWTDELIEALEVFLFGAYEVKKSNLSMAGRVVFHDAYPLNANRVKINGRLTHTYLGQDFITPHKSRKSDLPDALANPVPINFLKVLPGVLFKFQFRLHDFNHAAGTLTKDQIATLFQNLLLDLGAGAKTNVGYGQFILPSAEPSHDIRSEPEDRKQSLPATTSFEVGQEVTAFLGRPDWTNNTIEVRVDGNKGKIAPIQVAKRDLDKVLQQKKITAWVRAVHEDGTIKYLNLQPPKTTA